MLLHANILQPLIDLFEVLLVFFHDNVGLGWGASIIFMTLLIRLALLPLTLKQMRAMQNLARHQPELKKLQEKYKGDRERLNQEMMKFYKENQVNPFASCLPLLAQFPVFIALFYLLREDLRYEICPDKQEGLEKSVPCGQTSDSEFFFIPDLTNKATGGVLILLLVLYVGSQMASTLLSTMTADKTQRTIFLLLPVFFVPLVFTFPAGLLLYWITTNLWTIVQGVIVRRRVGPIKPPDDPDNPSPGGLSGLLGLPSKSAAEPAVEGLPPSKGRTTAPPPPPPRKKKKRSGRRR
jgi:YidC/Oxa1 family membrane protein insertase